jgi:hypothetical protein
MDRIETIVSRVNRMAPVLSAIQWEPFRQSAVLEFSSNSPEQERIRLRLDGVQFFATRQSLLGGPVVNDPSERRVNVFAIFNGSAFVQQTIGGKVQICEQLFMHDTHGRSMCKSDFTSPLHVNVNCSDGILDVICESVAENGH